jgi:leucyl-tRNA synthetase
MRQWMLRITAYADRLIDDLDEIDWPESLKNMQRNWIGRSEGARITFPIQDTDYSFEVFTTRPDTLFGATYCVLAPEHDLVEHITTAEQRPAVQAYVEQAKQKTDLDRKAATDKTGIFTGAYATNPANDEALPIWVADYVLATYGTGAIMAVPGHDTRDHEFARQFDLPIVQVVQPMEVSFEVAEAAYEGEGLAVNSGVLDGLPTAQAKEKMIQVLEEKGQGRRDIQYQLRDWLFSRQRYWGEPFPIIHLEDGTTMAVPESELPVLLPDDLPKEGEGVEGPPLARAGDDWLMVTLPDGRTGVRETNTMPQWAGSCWYYLRFIDARNDAQAWRPELEAYWMPVDLYIGGVEHAVLHLLYARFWHKVLYDCGLVSTKEPFQQLFNQGMILADSYQDAAGRYYNPKEVEERDGGYFTRASGEKLHVQTEKMSKSKHNVFSLDEVVGEYGADALRLYELFIGPLSASGPWLMNGLEGVYRFLQRVWRLVIDEETGEVSQTITDAPADAEPELNKRLHQTIQKVTDAIESLDKMNTAVSQLMTFLNAAYQAEAVPRPIISDFLRLLSPIAPHIAEELWERLGATETIAYEAWPVSDPELAAEDMLEIPVQINGRLRATITVPAEADKDAVQAMALADGRVQAALDGLAVRKVVVVPGRVVNVVTG